MPREILHINHLEKTTPEFRRKLIEIADRRGLNPSYLAAVIRFESDYNPQAVNRYSGATGLIQWLRRSAKAVGTTQAELLEMTAEEQLDYVEKHYALVDPHKRIRSIEDHYLAVFSPAYMFKPPGTAMYKRPEGGCAKPPKGAYCQNAPLDRNDDGAITNTEAASGVLGLIKAAQGRPPLLVEDAPSPAEPLPELPKVLPAGLGLGGASVPLAAGLTLGYLFIRYMERLRS